MFHLFDLHVHTPFSDGQHSIETVLELLIDLQIKVVGFADHIFPFAFYKHPKDGSINPGGVVNNWSEKMLRYRKEVFRIYDKRYPSIRILNGGEIDIYPHGGLSLPPGSITYEFFDYLLVSKHHTVPKQFNFFYKRTPKIEQWMWKHNPRLRLNTYLWEKGLYEAFHLWNPDIFAHPQIGMPRYMSKGRIKRFLLYCKKYDVAFELNSFPLDKQHIPLLEMGHELGVKFSLGSDFHGFKSNLRELIAKSQKMYEIAERYDLMLIDPRKFMQK